MVQSRLRSPASTWATKHPALAATTAQASVEFVAHHRGVRPELVHQRLEGHHHPADLLAMAARTHPQRVIGRANQRRTAAMITDPVAARASTVMRI